MPKAEWGTKHSCTACPAKFYDFNRSLPYCPQCGTIIALDGGDPPPDAPEDDPVRDDDDATDVTLETDDDVEGEEDPEIED